MKSRHFQPVTSLLFPFTLLLLCGITQAEENAADIAFFESKIRPTLVEHCYKCHSSDAKSVKGGLLLDTKNGIRAGGESGASVIPRNPDESLLLSALRYEDYEMPPSGQLSDSVIADFEKWIRMGAPDPRVAEEVEVIRREIDLDAGRSYWAFQPVQLIEPPSLQQDEWSTRAVDKFIYAKMSDAKVHPVTDADAATWLRRAKFDLVGLPPTLNELKQFRSDFQDNSALAKHAVVERWLSSSHFGERWARHWLDLARYAESTGRTRNYPFPFAWRYRDYVIHAINDDKPYDQFILEQLAGDLLVKNGEADVDEKTREAFLTATGFLAVGSPDLNERNAKIYQMDMVADQIDTISRSMLGLTVGCARCHDHKFDPIPTEDYYALAGIFKSTQLLNGYASRQGGANKARGDLLINLSSTPLEADDGVTKQEQENQERLAASRKAKQQAVANVERIKKDKSLGKKEKAQKLAQAKRTLTRKNKQFNQLRRKLKNGGVEVGFKGPACLGVREAKEIENCKVHIRGDITRLGDEVARGFLQVVSDGTTNIPANESGRLQLAQWIASSDNPLTARVLVNRVWHHLFGQGIVRTVDNFGEMGARPTHPELLDYLADQFMANGWSIKWLISELMLSRTYGLSVEDDEDNAQIDEHNNLLWRMNARRLDYEVLRDAMLAISGRLNRSPPTGSFVESLKVNEISRQKTTFEHATFVHRSVYLPIIRNLVPDAMSYFDFPDTTETRGSRDLTTVPTQSLFLMNSPMVVGLARATAKSIMDESQGDDPQLVDLAYQRIFGRSATEAEALDVLSYVQERVADLDARNQPKVKAQAKKRKQYEIAWSEVVHAMFASGEFRYR